mmetsp:Transcript_12000/g.24998  ORF Transcript_12000/g.24998 Transcript_12000/m.24998 type:complete len:238 (+) Transcript_12000:115-828(+)
MASKIAIWDQINPLTTFPPCYHINPRPSHHHFIPIHHNPLHHIPSQSQSQSQPPQHLPHLLRTGHVKALLLRHPGQLHVLRPDLLLHHLLQRPQRQFLRLLQAHALPVALAQVRLRSLAPGPDGLGLVPHERTGRVREEQLRTVQRIVSRQKQRNTERTRHALCGGTVRTFPERQRQVANGLRQRLHPDRLVVRERVILRLHPRVVHQRPRVRHQSAHRRSDVTVDLRDLLHAVRIQ